MTLGKRPAHPTPLENEMLLRGLMAENLRRGLILAYVAIIVEAAFAIIDIGAGYLQVHQSFQFDAYLVMYLLMVAVCGIYVIAVKRFGNPADQPLHRVQRFHAVMVAYITFIMVWGSVITLIDQALYGQVNVFIVNMLTCSVLYAMSARSFFIPYALSSAVLLIGLPLVQHSFNVLFGHYVNLCFFILVAWIASRMLYRYYCSDFAHRAMLRQANLQLHNTVAEYNRLNEKLTQANSQLKEASLLDDLTGIPNRRSFRIFINRLLAEPSQEEMCFSVLMIDVDCFKQYNDHYGHAQGDEVLKAVSSAIEQSVDCDVRHVVRWGGEEFLCALFHPSGEDISLLAHKVHGAVQALNIPHADSKVSSTVSISVGGATQSLKQRGDISLCIERADQALYRAKAAGRNQCCVDREET